MAATLVCSSPMQSRKMLACEILGTFATNFSIYDIAGTGTLATYFRLLYDVTSSSTDC